MTTTLPQPPRLFWRRLFAALLDLFILNAVFFFILLLAQPLLPGKIVIDLPIGVEYCEPLEETEELTEYARRLDPTLALPREFTLCSNSVFGQFAHDWLTVEVITGKSESATFSRRFGTIVDSDFNTLLPFDFTGAFMMVTPLILAALSFWRRTTPGKTLFQIRLYNKGTKPTFGNLAWREYLRFAPFVLYSGLQLLFIGIAQISSYEVLLSWLMELVTNPIYWVGFIATYLAALMYYLVPLVRCFKTLPHPLQS